MISINLGTKEVYNTTTGEFEYIDGGIVDFEYSLKAVYEWEARWRKPFLSTSRLTVEETVDFYRCMAIQEFDTDFLNEEISKTLSNYISDPLTATTFTSDGQNGKKVQTVKKQTAEEIYAIMFMNGIPIEFENRNLNRLLTILRVIAVKSEPPKKMSKAEVMKQNSELNKLRKAQLNTKG